jgi:hypothetical protein
MRHGIVLFTCDRGITPAPAEAVEAYLDRLASRIATAHAT